MATNSCELAGFLTTVRGRKVFGKQGMAGTLEEAVFRLVLYIAERWGLGSKLTLECLLGRDNYIILNLVLPWYCA